MPIIALSIKANMENVSDLQPMDFTSHQWSLKCTGCRETSDKFRYISADEIVDLPNSRGQANYVEKCGFCSKQNNIVILTDSFKPYTENEEFQVIVRFECRGTEPVEFEPTGEWKCGSTLSNAVFTKIDLSDTFADYDENASEAVTIDGLESKLFLNDLR
ncbi:hypothetical protein M3Y97_00015500 [Aphelenchoides bicaudatus]|nr:hypothetical protein M3Y97_00015500 [Aphelenchoides bicaudatus]